MVVIQKLVHKQLTQRETQREVQHADSKTRLVLGALQKQLMLLRLEEYLLLVTFIIGGVLGRALLQGIPSVEPITFFAVLAGALFGSRKGAATGAASWYLSNYFVYGGQGPWSVIHIAGGACAGYLGGILLHKKCTPVSSFTAMIAATVFFEVVMNIASGFFFGFGIIISFATAIPFMLIHLFSNGVFSCMIPPAKKWIQTAGKLDEKELCLRMMHKIKAMHAKNPAPCVEPYEE